jgi:hypothetical protein
MRQEILMVQPLALALEQSIMNHVSNIFSNSSTFQPQMTKIKHIHLASNSVTYASSTTLRRHCFPECDDYPPSSPSLLQTAVKSL